MIAQSDKSGSSETGASGLPAPGSYDVLGVPVSQVTMASACALIEQWARDDKGRFVCVRDVASLMAIREDAQIRDLHLEAAMIVPDGMPLVAIGRKRGHPIERVCGPDLFEEMMRRAARNGLRHYLFGGKQGVAEELAQRMRARFPGVEIVGYDTPPFRPMSEEEENAALERIRRSGADIVWVGLSSPKQDVWMWRNYRKLPQTLIGVGAAFDFHSGEVRRAPRWMQRIGLEWAWRVAQEPRRLWRRYLVLGPKFLWLLSRSSRSGT